MIGISVGIPRLKIEKLLHQDYVLGASWATKREMSPLDSIGIMIQRRGWKDEGRLAQTIHCGQKYGKPKLTGLAIEYMN